MAFNPFSTFRKHKRVLFAALTIMCMFTFVLSFGVAGRDFFTEMPRWFGGGRGSNKIVKIDGDWVRERDLADLLQRRKVALAAIVGGNQFAASILQQEDRRKGNAMAQRGQQLQSLGFSFMIAQYSLQRPEELLDFIMWRHQADRLGITLNDPTVDSLYGRFTDNQITLNQVLHDFAQNSRERLLPLADMRSAVGDEFRVRLAREAILGQDSDFGFGPTNTLLQTPTEVTPYAFWKYFKDNLTTVDAEVLPIPVSSFHTDKQPTDRDIKILYNEYKNDEPAADRSAPAFKVPKQIQIQWIEVHTEDSYYLTAAREKLVPLLQAVAFTTIPLANLHAGAGPGVSLLQATEYASTNLPLLREYETYVARQKEWATSVERTYRDVSLEQPEVPLTAIVHSLGSFGIGGLAFEAPGTLRAGTTVASFRSVPPQAIAGALVVLANAGPDTLLVAVPNTLYAYHHDEQVRRRHLALASGLLSSTSTGQLGSLGMAGTLMTEPLPLDRMKEILTERLTRQLARELATGELLNLRNELATRAKAKPKDNQKWLSEELPRYHFKAQQTTQLHTQFNLDSDPAIKPLREAWLQNQPATMRDDEDFARSFFTGQATTLFSPQTLPQSEWDPKWKEAGELVMYWVTEEKAPYVPPLEEVRDKVVQAWKTIQDRQLAKQEADRLATQLRERKIKGDDVRYLTELGSKEHWVPFSLDQVAKLQEPKSSSMAFQANFGPYQVPKDKIRYPGPKFVDDLLEKLKQPGDVTVLNDQPEKIYYVLVLKDRQEPAMERFAQVYRQSSGQGSLYSRWISEQHREYRDAALRQLRIESGILDESGNPKYELSDDFKRSLLGRQSEE